MLPDDGAPHRSIDGPGQFIKLAGRCGRPFLKRTAVPNANMPPFLLRTVGTSPTNMMTTTHRRARETVGCAAREHTKIRARYGPAITIEH